MPRRARLTYPQVPLHVIQRGNNRAACFLDDHDREIYLGLLAEHAQKCDCTVHAYVLMTNHSHLLLTPAAHVSASALMKAVGERYVPHFNKRHGRTGTLWEGRFRSSIIDSDRYFHACSRYIELNPVRAGMVRHPREHAWSSYGANADGRASLIIRPHAQYLALGPSPIERCQAYRALVDQGIGDDELECIRLAIRSGSALGSVEFLAGLEDRLLRRVSVGKSGRPRNASDSASFLW